MENIRYGRLDATDDEVIAAARTASADSFIRRLSDGYNTMIEGDGANLSQGQRQLLNIARAALSKAPILVLDEATSSVDTRTERHIEEGMDTLTAIVTYGSHMRDVADNIPRAVCNVVEKNKAEVFWDSLCDVRKVEA